MARDTLRMYNSLAALALFHPRVLHRLVHQVAHETDGEPVKKPGGRDATKATSGKVRGTIA